MSQTTAYISFDVLGTVHQEILILDPDLTSRELIRQLEDGELFTSLDVNHPDMGGDPRVIYKFKDDGTEVVVAKIMSQTAMTDNGVRMSRFTLEDDDGDEAEGDETTG